MAWYPRTILGHGAHRPSGLALAALLSAAVTACQRPQAEPTMARPRVIPQPRTVDLGRSVDGTPLRLEVFGNGPDHVFIFGGIHGHEPTSAALAAQLADDLRARPELWDGRTIGVLARANPDGLARRTRGNRNGVDLNRNFPARNWRLSDARRPRGGSSPASEPETQALIKAVELLRPARVVAIHSIPRGKHCNNFDGPAESLAQAMTRHNGYPAKPNIGYPTPGSFGNWAGVDQGIPTITLELPRDADDATCWRENRAALLAFIRAAARPAAGAAE